MKEGSDMGGGGDGGGDKGERRGGEAGGSVGYPFESWKLIQTADMLMNGQTALCVSLYCPVIQPHYTLRTSSSLWKHLLCFLIALENMHNITNEYTHSLCSPLCHVNAMFPFILFC